jgi:hypothetical protein
MQAADSKCLMEDASFYKFICHNESLCVLSSMCDRCEVKYLLTSQNSEMGRHVPKSIFRLFQDTIHTSQNQNLHWHYCEDLQLTYLTIMHEIPLAI